jgi:DNA-binding beta-propeller fold protein YncE
MTKRRLAPPALFALLAALLAVSCGTDDGEKAGAITPASDPVPTADAFLPAGPAGDDRYVLPSGRMITRTGERVTIRPFPTSIVAGGDGRLFVTTARDAAILTIDADTLAVLDETEMNRHFSGLAINAAGTVLYVGGGTRDVVRQYDVTGPSPVLAREIPAAGYPLGLALSADEATLYVTLATGKRVAAIDLASGTEVRSYNTGYYPHTVAVSEALGRLITSNWGTTTVSIFETATGDLLADVAVGKGPEGLVVSDDGLTAYVACSDADEIDVIDLAGPSLAGAIPVHAAADSAVGAAPSYVALGPGGRLYAVSSGFNAIDVIDPEAREVLGRVPTDWYPTAVLPTADALYVAAAKGTGSKPGSVGEPLEYEGTFAAIPMPDDERLAEYTAQVEENNTRTARFFGDEEFDSPVPRERGEKSKQIRHVVLILKENKTYDQVLGDVEGTNADPSLLLFGERITPNLHALSRGFAMGDNYYAESHESDQGHMWAAAGICNDYVEKVDAMDGWTVLTGVETGAIPRDGFAFTRMLDWGVSFRIYGEVTGALQDIGRLAPYIDFDYGFYSQNVSDRRKAREVIREWEHGIFPRFIYISLPNDHTFGTSPGSPTMDYMVADNDAALGMLVEWISRSRYWPETAVFIIEDDPQSGLDHVDAHRSPLAVVSPWARRGQVSRVHYSMSSVWATMGRILGIPALSDYDRFAAPMYDLFTMTPDYAPYTAIPSNVPFQVNPEDLPLADYCARQDWTVPDQVERISEVAWAYMRPGEPFPVGRFAPRPEEDEDEERAEGMRYRNLMEAYLEYGKKHGLIGPNSLVGKNLHP